MKIGVTGEGIWSSKEASWDMDDFKIKVSKVEQPPHLATVEVLCLTEVRQVLVICEDLDEEWGSMEVMSPGLQGMDDGEELPVVDVIVSFCRDERLGEVGTRVPVTVYIGLEEDGTRGIFRGICGDGKGFGEVREVEDRA